jgi:protein-histidine N-methyltransferase
MPFQFFSTPATDVEPQALEQQLQGAKRYQVAAQSYTVMAERSVHGLWKRHLADIKLHIASLPPSSSDTALTSQTDLIRGVYEGGLKTWEGAVDLLHFLCTSPTDLFSHQHVLELGCGSALPGILALKRGAESVDFMDYNEEVLEAVTVPNILVNTTLDINTPEETLEEDVETEQLPKNVALYSGDWATLPSLINTKKYDIILTSETLYEASTIETLYKTMCACLAPSGTM